MVCFLNEGQDERLVTVTRMQTIKDARETLQKHEHTRVWAIVGETPDGRRYLVDARNVTSYHDIDMLAQACDTSRVELESKLKRIINNQ